MLMSSLLHFRLQDRDGGLLGKFALCFGSDAKGCHMVTMSTGKLYMVLRWASTAQGGPCDIRICVPV